MSQTFAIGDVLSVTTGRLVSRDHIAGVYRVCDYMSGDANFTHALPRVSEEATPEILRQHPWLAEIVVPEWDKPTKETVFGWLDEIEARYGATVELSPMDPADHTRIDPISEFRMMRPDAVVVPVIVGDIAPPDSSGE